MNADVDFQRREYPIEDLEGGELLSYEVGDVSEYSDVKITIEGIFRFEIHPSKRGPGNMACIEARQSFIRMERELVDEEGELRAEAEGELRRFLEAKHEEYRRELARRKNREGRIDQVRTLKGKGGKR